MPKMTCENDVKREIRKLAKQYGCYDRASAASAFSRKGMPDRHMCCRGWFIGVEAKYGNNWLTQQQADDLKEIAEAGGIALVINETSLRVLEWVLNNLRTNRPRAEWWDRLPQHKPGYLESKK